MVSFLPKIPKPLLIFSCVGGAYGLACLIKDSYGGLQYKGCYDVQGKIAIVTGASTGVGKETTWEFARRGMKVYMACRDLKRCEATREEIVLDTKNKYVYCRKCDLESLQSIRDFVKQFKMEQSRLDVLVNNAGVFETTIKKTREGFEKHLGVNHLGHFLLTNLLLNILKNSTPSRIINISCINHKKGQIKKDDLNSENNFNAEEAYAQSKLANLLFTKTLVEKLKGTDILVSAVNPGIVDSEINRNMGYYNSWMAKIFVKPFLWPFIKNPKQGAQTIIYMAIDPEAVKFHGKYVSNYEETETSEAAKDSRTANWLWAVSEKWTRLDSL